MSSRESLLIDQNYSFDWPNTCWKSCYACGEQLQLSQAQQMIKLQLQAMDGNALVLKSNKHGILPSE